MKLVIILIVFLILAAIHVATHAQTMRADGKTVTKMTLMAMFATIGPVYAFGGFIGYMLIVLNKNILYSEIQYFLIDEDLQKI